MKKRRKKNKKQNERKIHLKKKGNISKINDKYELSRG